MPIINKFFKAQRDKTPTLIDFDQKFPKLIKNATDLALWDNTGDRGKKEPFVIEAVSTFIKTPESYRIAKNMIGDVLIEFDSSNTVVSIANSGIFSIYTPIVITESSKQGAILSALIAYKASMNNNSFFNDLQSLYEFIAEIRDEIYNRQSTDFMKSDGTVNVLDLSLGLPNTTGMVAQNSVDISIDPYGFEKIDYIPDGDDFQNIVVADNTDCHSGIIRTFEHIESFNVTPDRVFTIGEEEIMAENEEIAKDFIVTPTAKGFLEDFFDLYKAGIAPSSCAFYGPSGAGKTVMAQVLARELHRPYVAFKMRENSDEDSLRGSIKNIADKDNGGEITYEDSPIVKALKNGWVCEVQELSVCSNQGAETFFNPILDKTKTFEDASGKTFTVHPDALIIFTYNPDYCENNQIATSLLNRIDDSFMCEFPDKETAVNILRKETGYSNLDILGKIYDLCFGDGSSVGSISVKLKDEDAEEELSLRQVSNWIKRYANCRRYYNQEDGWVNAAMSTIVHSLAQREPELQADIISLIESVL